MPDGIALAPWERPSELPPEKDGFFLLEALPGGAASADVADPAAGTPADPGRPPLSLAVLFDTSLSHRWAGLEAAYGHLVRVLRALRKEDRFVLIPFDRAPDAGATLRPATPEAVEDALVRLRARPLGRGNGRRGGAGRRAPARRRRRPHRAPHRRPAGRGLAGARAGARRPAPLHHPDRRGGGGGLPRGLGPRPVNDVSAAGVLYVSCAANGGGVDRGTSGTWEGDFKDGGPATQGRGGRVHDFGGVAYNTVTPGGSCTAG